MNERKVLDYTGWRRRIENVGVNTPWSLENLLELDDRILDMQERLQGTDIGSFEYKSLANDIRESMQGIDVLYRYATDTERAIDELDTGFMTALSKGAVEDLSLIRMDDITVDNTIGMKETYMVGYGDSRCAVERTKNKLTLNDFIGGEGAGCMTGYVKEFADLFRNQYLEAGGKEENFPKYLEELYTIGEFDHKKYQPVRTFVSNGLDVVMLGSKPLLEGLLQYEFITGETLTDDESVFKVVEGVVSLFTFWMGTAGKGAGTIAKAFLTEAAAGTTTEVVNYLGEEMGLPPIVRNILALGIGLGVGGKINQYFVDKDQLWMNYNREKLELEIDSGSATHKLPNAEGLKMTQTVCNHMNNVIKRGPNAGMLSRPYIDSEGTTLLLKEIMESADPVSDTILQSGLRWDVLGTFRGTKGTWELVVDTSTNMVVHFNFVAQ